MAIAQAQILNKILNTKDMSLITVNDLSEDYFFDYIEEYKYIKNHYNKFNSVPDKLTFKDQFNDFTLCEVNEPDTYLLDQLYNEYNYANLSTAFNKIRDDLASDNVEAAVQNALNVVNVIHRGSAMTCTDLTKDTSRYDNYMKRATTVSGSYLTTGFPELDAVIGGIDMLNENLVIVARTGVGKTMIMLKMAAAAALAGKTVGIYEGEMTADKVGYRIDTFLGNISNKAMNRGDLASKNEYEAYIKGLKNKDIGAIKVFTPTDVANGRVTVDTLRAFVEKEHIDILFIDQYSLMEDTSKAKTTFEKVGNIARDIKLLQVEKQIPIVAVAQQNRSKNEDNVQDSTQVGLSDLIPQYATVLLMLEKKVFETEDGRHHTELSINVAKARDGGDNHKLIYEVDFNKGRFTFIEDQTAHKAAGKDIKDRYKCQPNTNDGAAVL